MNTDWLWDRNIPLEELQKILKDEKHERFIEIVALLLARKNDPKEVFSDYLDRQIFARNWPRIKKQMRRDDWNNRRIIFWQAVYEKLVELLKGKGISVRPLQTKSPMDELCANVGAYVKAIRQQQNLTQEELAQKIGISQQVISRVETGQENLSLLSLKKIAQGLQKAVVVNFS